jgi:hypothetical protein
VAGQDWARAAGEAARNSKEEANHRHNDEQRMRFYFIDYRAAAMVGAVARGVKPSCRAFWAERALGETQAT